MEDRKEVQVGVAVFPPLVNKTNQGYEGFEIDLLEQACAQLGYKPTYVLYEFKELLPALTRGEVRVAAAGITRTEARERVLDFSHRTLDSGLSILVQNTSQSTLLTAIKAFFSKDMLKIFSMLLIFVVVSSHLVWFAERGGGGTISESYVPGVFEAAWWSVVTVSTVGYGDFFPVTWYGRVAGMLVILSGLAIFGLYIGQISSSLTLQRLKSSIRDKSDLRGKIVATLEGTEAVNELHMVGAKVVEVTPLDKAYEKLNTQRVDAVVFDTPVLQNHIKMDTEQRHALVGAQFRAQTYGFAFVENDPLCEDVNRVLLHLRESGAYEHIYNKWF